jgi:hypothetical protein
VGVRLDHRGRRDERASPESAKAGVSTLAAASTPVDPRSGRSRAIAGGFLGATDLELDGRGRIVVSGLFAERASVIRHGNVHPYVSLDEAPSLVWPNATLYAGTLGPTDEEGNPTGPGSLVVTR